MEKIAKLFYFILTVVSVVITNYTIQGSIVKIVLYRDIPTIPKVVLFIFTMIIIIFTLIVTIYGIKNILSNPMFIGSLKKVFCSDFEPNPDRSKIRTGKFILAHIFLGLFAPYVIFYFFLDYQEFMLTNVYLSVLFTLNTMFIGMFGIYRIVGR